YRNMLLNELSGDSLFVGQAIPRAWLADGKQVKVSGAPTYFGPVNLMFTSETAKGIIQVVVEFRSDRRPPTLLVRLRHPEEKPLQAVTVNGQKWAGFDAIRERVRIGAPQAARYDITAHY
ncbi:MAG TPA: hypothetical protein VFT34_14545, partial [Verrucomicrobiae bacterium]|nr:hypothetical protein [Verrucomicrobiae bacterium]